MFIPITKEWDVKEQDIIDTLGRKAADHEAIAAEVLQNPGAITVLLGGLSAKKANIKYGSEKVLRLVSERQPELLYPHFDRFVELMDGENKFLKWGGIMILSNLAAVDTDRRIEQIFERYFTAITGPVMVTAANIVGGAVKIARANPDLTDKIVAEILKVEKARYLMHGEPSPECNNVVCGQAVGALAEIYDQVSDRKEVREFIDRQLHSSRPAVRKKAKQFFATHKEAADE
ncbi:MAG: hypothetical protein JSV89_03125 [Spirochaetaceae bacterium]|nr:MAG: hypothetical protein JSV89_03125 [Spirochaetaceae bacterium]